MAMSFDEMLNQGSTAKKSNSSLPIHKNQLAKFTEMTNASDMANKSEFIKSLSALNMEQASKLISNWGKKK